MINIKKSFRDYTTEIHPWGLTEKSKKWTNSIWGPSDEL